MNSCSTHLLQRFLLVLHLLLSTIDRDDPCENCLCLDGNMFCWWAQQHCSNTTTTAAVTTDYTTTTAELNNSSWSEETSSESVEVSSVANTTEIASPTPNTNCIVMGREYTQGSVLPRDTGTCLECVCGNEGRVTCSPKDCVRPNDDFHNSDPNNSLDMFDVDVF